MNIIQKTIGYIKKSFGMSGLQKYFQAATWEDSKISISDAYKTHAYVNIAVDKIATNAVRAEAKVYSGEKEVNTGPLYNLLTYVNPQMSRAQLIEATISWILTRGESLWVLSGEGLLPQRIDVFEPQNFYEYTDKEKTKVVMWEYRRNDGTKVPFLPSEIVHFPKWNPWNRFRGVNPLIAQSDNLKEDVLSSRSNISLLKNRAIPSGVLSSEQSITEDQAKGLVDRWNEAHKGSSKQHKIAVLGRGTSYQRITMTPADMEFYSMKRWNRSTILGKYGVPAIVAGFKDETTPLSGSDTKQQMEFFWTITLLPLLKFLEDKLKTELTDRFFPNQFIKFDTSNILELQVDLEKQKEGLRKDVLAGILTQNEARKELKKDPIAWGNTWWKSERLKDVESQEEAEPVEEKQLDIFDNTKYTESFISKHWWNAINNMEETETGLKKVVNKWLFEQRKTLLEGNEISWNEQKQILHEKVQPFLKNVSKVAKMSLETIYKELSVESVEVNIPDAYFDTRANEVACLVNKLEAVGKIKDKDTIRSIYKEAQAKCAILARVAVMGVYNEIRMKSFLVNGFNKHSWCSGRDKEFNVFDGEIVEIWKPFFNKEVIPVDWLGKNRPISLPVK